ncbi:PREDICTED: cell cycle checkpoint control protein RAD9B [Dipodomys ordii]|uniref:Cell cycle checkpoint control protein RAD9B n=1 Tax=Dipodomys ordii TaxID=10020 RepID=A0A1S3FPZ3_DIPOR|nr:PREDICTED: cell cycle checkpoint control protein RAD9B [Dipodomys ordii]
MLKCTMNGGQLKVFGKTIQALARLSNELWLDPSKQGLVLRSINSSCSAYGYALFSPVFFEQYQWSTSETMNHDDIPLTLNFKFTMQVKSLLPIFKCLNFLERNVEKCKMFTKSGKCRFIIQLFCKHNMNSSVRSSMCVDRDEFDFFQIGLDTEVTFCLKDLKGFLTLCEAVRGPVTIHFDFPGRPVALSINDMLFEAHFYLATLADDPSRPPSPLSMCLPQEGERSSPARARLTLGQRRSSQAAESISRKISRKRLCPAESPPESGAQENHSRPLKKRAPSGEHPDRESSPVFRKVLTERLG